MLDDLTAEQVRELLNYDPETGVFTWRVYRASNAKIGDVAGTPDPRGYIAISISNRRYKAHRLAWLHMTGGWPVADIDHINRNPSDNRFLNLRQATRSQNLQNTVIKRERSSQFRGVSWHKPAKKWAAKIKVRGKQIYLGLFLTEESAYTAYCAAAQDMHSHRAVSEVGSSL